MNTREINKKESVCMLRSVNNRVRQNISTGFTLTKKTTKIIIIWNDINKLLFLFSTPRIPCEQLVSPTLPERETTASNR